MEKIAGLQRYVGLGDRLYVEVSRFLAWPTGRMGRTERQKVCTE